MGTGFRPGFLAERCLPIEDVAIRRMAENTAPDKNSSQASAAKAETSPASTKAAKAKKEKPPAPEDKPFGEFISQEFLPALESALEQVGVRELQLDFSQQPIKVAGISDPEEFWQVSGQWRQDNRRFNIVFTDEDIKSPKFFYFTAQGATPSTIEQFMGDERKVTLDLMVLYTLQRLNGQKWLTRN